MMKTLLTIGILLVAVTANAQFNYPIGTPTWYKRLRVDEQFWLNTTDTTISATAYPGTVTFRQQPGDTSLYLSTGAKHVKVGTGSVTLPGAQNGVRLNGLNYEYGNDTLTATTAANQIRPTVYNQAGQIFNWFNGATNRTVVFSKQRLSRLNPMPYYDTEVYSPIKLVNEQNSLLLKMYGHSKLTDRVIGGLALYDMRNVIYRGNKIPFPNNDSMAYYLRIEMPGIPVGSGNDTAKGTMASVYLAGNPDTIPNGNISDPMVVARYLGGRAERWPLNDTIWFPKLPTLEAEHRMRIGFNRFIGTTGTTGIDGANGYLDTTKARLAIYADDQPIKAYKLQEEPVLNNTFGFITYDGLTGLTKGNIRWKQPGGIAQVTKDVIDSVGGPGNAKTNVGKTITVVTGTPYSAFGDSYTVGSLATQAPRRYVNIIANTLGVTASNYGVGGLGVWQATKNAFLNLADQKNNNFLTWMAGYNDIRKNGGGIKVMKKVEVNTRSFIANAFLDTAVAATNAAITKTGTWTSIGAQDRGQKAQYIGSGQQAMSASTAGATAQWSFTGNTLVVGLIGSNGTTFNYDSIRIQIDGIDFGWWQTTNLYDNENTSGPMAIVLRNIGTGAHTVTLTKGGAASPTNLLLDYLGTLRDPKDCLPVAINSVPALLDSNYRYSFATYGAVISDTTLTRVNNVIKSVVEEFQGYPVTYNDINSYFDIYNDIASDSIHPNDQGHLHLANGTMQNINIVPMLAASTNIGNTNLTLSGNRTLAGDQKTLTFDNLAAYQYSSIGPTHRADLVGQGSAGLFQFGVNTLALQNISTIRMQSDSLVSIQTASAGGGAGLFTQKNRSLRTDLDSVLFLTGNVGIGTATPSTKLEVSGQVKITGGTPGAGKVLTSDAAGLATWEASTSGSVYNIAAFTSDYTALSTDQVLLNNDNIAPGPLVTLPAPSINLQGKWYIITCRGGMQPVTFSQTIFLLDGTTTTTLSQNNSYTIICDGVNWQQIK